METTEQYIDRAANQVVKAILRLSTKKTVSVSRVVSMIDLWCDIAENPQELNSLIKNSISVNYPEVYKLVWSPCYMDQNGNYTYDSNKWA